MAGNASPDPEDLQTQSDLLAGLNQLRITAARSRGKVRLSLLDLAAATGVPKSSLANYLAGRTLMPVDVLDRVVLALGVSLAEARQWAKAWERLAGQQLAPAQPMAPGQPRVMSMPFQLPPPPTVIVGRDAELRRVLEAVEVEWPLVVVEGAGGIGKSALALRAAHQLAGRYVGGCLYADLHGAGGGRSPADPADVLARFLRAVGSSTIPATIEERSALLRSLTAARPMLLLLDNAASAAQLRPLLPARKDSATLVTSRWKLPDLDCTARLALAPLAVEDAQDLVIRLAGDRPAAAEAIAALVRYCGGLPLALRIVAARLAVRPDTSLTDFIARLADEHGRLDQLQVGDLSVRTSLELGYQALAQTTDPEIGLAARVFRLAAVPDWADLTVRSVAALLGVPPTRCERALEHLVNSHLLETIGDGRLRFHDIVRLYARELAELVDGAPDRAAALARLTTALRNTAVAANVKLFPHDPPPWSDPPTGEGADAVPFRGSDEAWRWLVEEHTNLLLIARQQLAVRQSLREVRDLGSAVARFATTAGYVSEQAEFGRLAIQACDELGDRPGATRARTVLAVAMIQSDQLADGIDLLRQTLVDHRALGNRSGEAACLNNLGNALRDSGDLVGAADHLSASLAIRRELGDRHKESSTLDNLGLVRQRAGSFVDAIALHQQALALNDEVGDDQRQGLIMTNLAGSLHGAGRHAEAHDLAGQAVARLEGLSNTRGVGLALAVLADACAALGQPAQARAHRLRALDLLVDLDPDAYLRVQDAVMTASS